MKLGRWQFGLYGPDTAESPHVYRDRLGELAHILRDLPWMLVGGLAIPLTLGHFYRHHFDVDIAFPRHLFPAVEVAMHRAGYYLSTHFPMSLFGSWRAALQVPVTSNGWLPRWRTRKLKFRDGSGMRTAPHLLSVIEAFPFTIQGRNLLTCDGRHRLWLDRPLVGHELRVGDGQLIRCLDLHYVSMLKDPKDEEKDRVDQAMIREWRAGAVPSGR